MQLQGNSEKIPGDNLHAEEVKLIQILWREKALRISWDLNPNNPSLVFKLLKNIGKKITGSFRSFLQNKISFLEISSATHILSGRILQYTMNT